MSDTATIIVGVVSAAGVFGGGFFSGRQTQRGAVAVAKEETARLQKDIDEQHFKHRMVGYHNVLMLAGEIESSERHGYQGGPEGPRFLHGKFRAEVEGLAVFGASEPRRLAVAMSNTLGDGSDWLPGFVSLRDTFREAANADVGPGSIPPA
jgi:hypothetical protein